MTEPPKQKHLYRKPGYVYFRHPKTRQLTPLPLDEKSSDFLSQHKTLMAALKAELKATPKTRDPNARNKRDREGSNGLFPAPTLGFFIEKYLASDYFNSESKKAYAEGTRYNYRKHLDLLKARLGTGIFVHLDQETVEVYTAQVAREHGDSAGDDQIAMISNVWEHAKGFIEFKRKGRINPTTRIKRHYQHDGEGHLVWPDEVIEAFDTRCPWHLKFVRMGLHYTGQRGGDVVKMKWADFDGERIYVVQEKTGKKLWLKCPKLFCDVLRDERTRTNREHIFHHAYGAPFKNAQTLSHAIRNRLEDLKIEGYTMHGLRKNAGSELAKAGTTVREIMAVLGHKTSKMAEFYCAQAEQVEMNENAIVKLDAYHEKQASTRKAKGKKLQLVP